MVLISAVIVTKNEELFIERCVRSVLWADEVLILDSGSTDRTMEIARSLGANVYEHEWLGWGAQVQKAISLAKNDWVLVLDCDEIVTPQLAESIEQAMSGKVDERDGYSLDRRGDFLGILLPNIDRQSNRRKFVRLFNRRYSAYDLTMKIHHKVSYPGKAIPLEGVLLHWRGQGIGDLITSFNKDATLEAQMLNDKGYRATGLIIFLRPILRFLWCYFAKGGVFLGARGLSHSVMKATSEYIRYAKLWELQNTKQAIHPSVDIYPEFPKPKASSAQLLERSA